MIAAVQMHTTRRKTTIATLAAAAVLAVPAPAQVRSWNAFDDFYVDVPATGGSGDYAQSAWIAHAGVNPYDTGLTNANAWGYAGGDFNGRGAPSGVGTYVSGGAFHSLASGGTNAGPGASYYLGGEVPGQYFWIGYNDSYGSIGLPNGQTQIGKYTKEWFEGSPDWAANANGVNDKYLWLQATGLSGESGGMGAILTWTAPYAGTFSFSGSYVNGDYGHPTDFAIVDNENNVLLPKVTLPTGSAVSTFSFTNKMPAGGVVQFQVGTPAAAQGSPLGLAVDVAAAPDPK